MLIQSSLNCLWICVQCLSDVHELLRMLIQFSYNAPKMGPQSSKDHPFTHQFILQVLPTSSLSLLYSTIESSLDARSILIQFSMDATTILQWSPKICRYPIILPVLQTPSLPLIYSPIISHYLREQARSAVIWAWRFFLFFFFFFSYCLRCSSWMSIQWASTVHPPRIHRASTAHPPRIYRASTVHPPRIQCASIAHPLHIQCASHENPIGINDRFGMLIGFS